MKQIGQRRRKNAGKNDATPGLPDGLFLNQKSKFG
jgi:hypothetical protein